MQTFFAKITIHNQYDAENATITWRDPLPERWDKIYRWLHVGDRGFILGNGFVYSGKLESVNDSDSLVFNEVEAFNLRADRFLSLHVISPELNAQLKGALGQPFIFKEEIDYEAFKHAVANKRFLGFYIINSNVVREYSHTFKNYDRIITISDDLVFEAFGVYQDGVFQPYLEENGLFNVKARNIYEVIDIFEQVSSKKTLKTVSSNLSLLYRIRDTFENGGNLFKFDSFSGYYNIIHNKTALVYSKIQLVNYYVVGSIWDGHNPKEQKDRFIRDGIWQNGYDDKYLDLVKSVPVGSKIAIKAPHTQKNLYEIGKWDSVMTIKARGEVASNSVDGRNLTVNWEEDFLPFKVFFSGGYRDTINKVNKPEHVKAIFFNNEILDVDGEEEPMEEEALEVHKVDLPLNLILSGPPGTGKTFKIQQEYQQLFTDKKDGLVKRKRYDFITFHSNYSYEDFIEGIKPVLAGDGNNSSELRFTREQGIFYRACEKAVQLAGYENLQDCIADTSENRSLALRDAPQYALFIDEINRANISRVFGELITLIEDDKRLGARFEVTDTLLPSSKVPFGVPSNLHLIGTMNTADKSIALLDIALRRRFEFRELLPDVTVIKDPAHQSFFTALNHRVLQKKGKDFLIGHSYFMSYGDVPLNLVAAMNNKVLPLLTEYFYKKEQEMVALVKEALDNSDLKQQFALVLDADSFNKLIFKSAAIQTVDEHVN